MKKVMKVFAVGMLAMTMLAACGNKAQSGQADEATRLKDVDVDKYVTIGNYDGMEVFVNKGEIDEEEVMSLALQAYQSAVTEEVGGITDRAVEMGDTVIIDYEGKRDGVAFDGGTAQGADLTIGSGSFIDGFEDGLVGVMPGETVDLELTFPEDYHNEELAGVPVVFTVTVHYILPDREQMTEDAVVSTLGIEGVETVDQLIQYAKDYLQQEVDSQYDSDLQSAVIAKFMGSSTFEELPQGLIKEYQQVLGENLALEADQYNSYFGSDFDAETYAQQVYGYDSLEAFVTENAEEAVKQGLALQAVANRENLNLSDEELDARILELAKQAGYDTIEEYVGDTDKEDFREYFMNRDVLQFLKDHATVSENVAEYEE